MDTQLPEVTQPVPETTHFLWQHFSTKTLLLIFILLCITGGLLYIAIRQEQPQPNTGHTLTKAPTPSPAHTTLSLVSISSSGSAQKIAVVAQSNQNNLTAAQINLSFDPKVVSSVTMTSGTYFSHPTVLLNNIDNVNGRISFVIGIGPGEPQASGSGTIAVISYTLLPSAKPTTTIDFLPKTEVTQQGVLGSVLKSTSNITIPIPYTLQMNPTIHPTTSITNPVGY